MSIKIIKSIIYILVIGLFIMYLFFANRIVIAFIDGPHALYSAEQSFERIHNQSDREVISWLRIWAVTSGWYQQVALSGVAFYEAESVPNFQRQIKIMLINESGNVFVSDTILGYDDNNYAYFVEAGYNVPSYNIGFSTKFSPMLLEDGVYQIAIYVRETPETFGIKECLGIVLVKNGSSVHLKDLNVVL